MVYILTGGPATGKGTRSGILSEALSIPHISSGALLREASQNDEEIAKLLSDGILISDEIITNLLEKRISKEDCKKGFILDGFPRNITQVKILEDLLKKKSRKITKVIELVISDELAIKRVLERRQCIDCGKMYGIDFQPVIDNICDVCHGRLEIRTDDTKETLMKRIKTYNENSKEILDYYRNMGLLKTIDSSRNPEKIVEEIND